MTSLMLVICPKVGMASQIQNLELGLGFPIPQICTDICGTGSLSEEVPVIRGMEGPTMSD